VDTSLPHTRSHSSRDTFFSFLFSFFFPPEVGQNPTQMPSEESVDFFPPFSPFRATYEKIPYRVRIY